MARKIFFHPKTLAIKGMSDGENSMDFPFVETEIDYHSTKNLAIIRGRSGPELVVVKGTMD